MATEYVIAAFRSPAHAPSIFNFYPTREAAIAALNDPSVSVLSYYSRNPGACVEVMTWGEYRKIEHEFWLTPPPKEIDEEAWDDALGCLPPMDWHTVDGVERFLMSEFTTGSFTAQYARFRGRCFVKTVDARDKGTWITAEMLAPFFDGGGQTNA